MGQTALSKVVNSSRDILHREPSLPGKKPPVNVRKSTSDDSAFDEHKMRPMLTDNARQDELRSQERGENIFCSLDR